MNKTIKQLAVAIPILLVLDYLFIYLNLPIFERQVIQVQKFSLKMKPEGGFMCYLFLIFGLYYFILRDERSPLDAFWLGLVIYGVFECTNYSLFKNWKSHMVVLDTIWGGVLFYLTTYFAYLLAKYL